MTQLSLNDVCLHDEIEAEMEDMSANVSVTKLRKMSEGHFILWSAIKNALVNVIKNNYFEVQVSPHI